jgi:hypothetical protein
MSTLILILISQAVRDIYGDGFMEPRWPPGITGSTCRLHQDCSIPNPPVR